MLPAASLRSMAAALIVAAVLLIAASAADPDCPEEDSQQCTNPSVRSSDEFSCGLYLAQSTIPHSGLGIFSGVAHPIGSSVAPPEIALQLLYGFDDNKESMMQHAHLVHEYTWSSHVTGGSFEGKHIETLIPGLGMAANSFLSMVNTRSIMGTIDSAGTNFDEMGPGSGAFSSYHGLKYLAEVPIKAGAEVFVDYGDNYFRGRPAKYGMIPLVPEFETADQMLASLYTALMSAQTAKELLDKGDKTRRELDAIWHVIRNNFVSDERVRNALPESVVDLPAAVRYGTPYNFLGGKNPRSIDWLETNGYCIDTLSIGPSSIPHAGRGAFAKKSFNEGDIILPLPMVHLERSVLDIMEGDDVHSKQLILNYSFGHKDSSLLLYPYSSTSNFINHGSKKANAKVIWATDDLTAFHNDTWFSMSPNDLVDTDHTGLLMLLVATGPIKEGDEVTIDYGSDWENAWNSHVESWSSENMHQSAAELNESEKQIRTIFEDPYPVSTVCHYNYLGDNEASALGPLPSTEDVVLLKQKLNEIETHAETWYDQGGRKTMSGDHLRPCVVIARHLAQSDEDEDTYTVQMMNRGGFHERDPIPEGTNHYVKGVVRRAILFADSPHTSTQQNVKAFRHEIGFPNDIWPDSWKDSRE